MAIQDRRGDINLAGNFVYRDTVEAFFSKQFQRNLEDLITALNSRHALVHLGSRLLGADSLYLLFDENPNRRFANSQSGCLFDHEYELAGFFTAGKQLIAGLLAESFEIFH